MKTRSRLARSVIDLGICAALVGSAAAQGTPQVLIGGARQAPFGFLQQQAWCRPAAALCNLPYPAPPQPFAGGTAYNSFNQVVWDSNGPLLVGVSATSVPPCAVVCAPIPVPGMPAASLVGGLAFDELAQTLLAIDSTPAIRTFIVPPVGCPLPGFMCPLAGVYPPNLQPGGLAFSEKNQLLYFSVSNFAGGAPQTLIFASRPVNPCVPLCALPVPPCPAGAQLGPVTGLAFDDATDDLYVTDGAIVMRLTLNIAATPCTIAAVNCCQQPLVATYYGLELEASHPAVVGVSCLGAPCPVCPAMALASAGDPTVGAPYPLTVSNGPAGSNAVPLIGFPGCTLGFPFFCGLFHPPLAPLFPLPGLALAGVAPCGGSGTLVLPIPLNYSLSGLSFCVQAVVVCPGLGIGLTNALNGTVTDN